MAGGRGNSKLGVQNVQLGDSGDGLAAKWAKMVKKVGYLKEAGGQDYCRREKMQLQ